MLKIVFVPVCSFVSVVPAWAMMAISVSHRLGRECDGSVSVLNSSGLVMAIELAGQACDFQVFSSLQNARDFLKKSQNYIITIIGIISIFPTLPSQYLLVRVHYIHPCKCSPWCIRNALESIYPWWCKWSSIRGLAYPEDIWRSRVDPWNMSKRRTRWLDVLWIMFLGRWWQCQSIDLSEKSNRVWISETF